jgi:Cu/Ag efflux protein CusF
MKRLLITALVAGFGGVSVPGIAASEMDMHANHGMMHAHSSPSAEKASAVDGVVRKVDKAGSKVTVSHGPLPNGMPAMTMPFRVKEAAWLDRMKAGDKIRFVPEDVDGALTIVRFEPAK